MVTSKRVGLIVLGLLVVASLVAALIWVPKVEVYGLNQVLHPQKISPAFYKRDVFTQEDRARQTLATIVGGFLVLAGAYMTWRTVRAAERNAEIARDNAETARKVAEQNAETAQKNIEIAEDKQITDRFTAAVINLSADKNDRGDNLAQRLGGIYALERIARDSPDDHWTVMEVLTAYVRDKCPRNEIAELEAQLDVTEAKRQMDRVLPTDIQAILTVIGRRNAEQDKRRKLNIYHVDLSKAYLVGANLRQAVMGEAYLAEANLERTDLTEAYLVKANLTDAYLGGIFLSGANLTGAILRGADLRGADLTGAILRGADLRGADLSDARLWATDLSKADLGGAKNLTQEQLDNAFERGIPAMLPTGLHFMAAPDVEYPL